VPTLKHILENWIDWVAMINILGKDAVVLNLRLYFNMNWEILQKEETRQEIYLCVDTEALSRYHFYCGKAINIDHYGYVSLFSSFVSGTKIISFFRRILFYLWPVPIFPHYLINGMIFGKKKFF
jgi:hypothetical protein